VRPKNIRLSGCNQLSTKSIATVLVVLESCTAVRFLTEVDARIIRKMSAILMYMGRVHEAVEFYRDEFTTAKLIEDSDRAHFDYYSGMGKAMALLGKLEEAINYSRMSLKIAEQVENFSEVIQSYSDSANCLTIQGEIGEAAKHLSTPTSA
jgi:tetratricopeptide (TPR) repeat protein